MPKSREAIPLPYEFLEEIKNGDMTSGKYVPIGKHPKVPNVVIVFSNHLPHTTRLSEDRYKVHYKIDDTWVRANLSLDHRDADGQPVYIWKIRCGDNGMKTMWNPHQRAEVRKHKRQLVQDEVMERRLKKMREEEGL
ncbi:expressed unknown protein [Seminavis robusta]|uniref:Uncharacterized protein n=1 Tax=Seminavis robusta TaxID=568900 RepID=A0A9N8ER43_9STRA|nr:expressed unknown protein [Seminavis robusta]|eukprot:Sro1435_g272350.1 n/a (137) ;mRNA; r:4100-4510